MVWNIAFDAVCAIGFVVIMIGIGARAHSRVPRVCVRCGARSLEGRPWRVFVLACSIVIFANTIGFLVGMISGVTEGIVSSTGRSGLAAVVGLFATVNMPLMVAGGMLAYLTNIADPACATCGAKMLIPVIAPKAAENSAG